MLLLSRPIDLSRKITGLLAVISELGMVAAGEDRHLQKNHEDSAYQRLAPNRVSMGKPFPGNHIGKAYGTTGGMSTAIPPHVP